MTDASLLYPETSAGEASENAEGWQTALPGDLKDLAANKGWKEPADALKSYKHLEGLLGADKSGRGLVLPKDENDAEGYARVYKALGRPENADGYGLGEMFSEQLIDSKVMAAMAGAMHEAGLSKAQAQKLSKAYQDLYLNTEAGVGQRYQEEMARVEASVSPTRLESARRAFRLMGLSAEDSKEISRTLERTLGMERAVQIFAELGSKFPEDRPVEEAQGLSVPSSPSAAQNRMDNLLADKDFRDRYLSGDKAAIEEITELARRATAK